MQLGLYTLLGVLHESLLAITISRELFLQLNCEYLANPKDGHLSQIHLDGKEGLDRKVQRCRAPTVKVTGMRPCCGHLWMIRRRPGGAGPGENELGWGWEL